MAKPSNEAAKAMENFFEEIFFSLLTAMLRSEVYDEAFAKIRGKAAFTKSQLHNIARHAAQYYQSRVYPSPGKLSREKVHTLKTEALESALKKVSKEREAE